MTTIATTNPATGEVEKTFDALADEEVDRRIARAAETFASYRTTRPEQRAEWMNAAADILDREADQIGAMLTTEMGKTLKAAVAEVRKCAKACRFYAGHAAEFLADRRPAEARDVGARDAYVRYQPLGPVLAIMPWNFPLWQVVRFAAPGLMAGNVGLLKHSSNVPQTALFLEDLFRRAGFPEGAFQTLLIGSSEVERVLRDPRVKAATLTGSEPAGRSVAAIAGDEVKPTVLELGGSDPFVVMPSADIEAAARTAAESRCLNNGQSCISAKRFIADIGCADEFERRFVEHMRAKRVGDPMDGSTDVGPLFSEEGRAEVEELVADAVAKGATVLCGGERPDGPGWFYPPTVLSGVTPEMRMYHEEVFGPVASLFRVRGVSEAVEVANATGFGLGSNAWTRDDIERDRFVRELDAGQVFINGMVTSYPELPFGGVKRSGYGRELSADGLRAFCNAKTVWEG
ncbi:NADP-dependent succinic semialdehyde dehydrogenase [Actinomadura madurae]|uniref:NADP-dependent succinic semialdehyde dehydrogenase n=1 Tax=Actinomadura madurae TaxID=1993 RepID=UPI0020D229FE|nr:NADP-dependent succinic semialdehyde dehydrogenase [Actinomadura madurae]MCP9947494.1 NADP-dependent succinic semialdehyde dehydrogenase [Actinomadura madurae]MCP9964262.1 NADP-dependent succinic semialdehyde dehydrogenase [Actinomadura madurae]MCP9976742.1 NADP-dependent succinic semialdehyde dehydrogenase [Actinomadura madurae]MCQ0011769.1 NADP-dependent succinic semialdehyde dehydrogenase [Actinomadura madurae]